MSDPNDKQKCADCGHPAHRQACTAHVGFDGDWCPCVGSSYAPSADGSAAEVKRYFVHNRIDREHGYEMPCSVEMVDASAFDAVVAERDQARRTGAYWKDEHNAANDEIAALLSRVAELERVLRRLEIELRRFASGGTRPAPYQVEEMHKWAFDVLSKGAQP